MGRRAQRRYRPLLPPRRHLRHDGRRRGQRGDERRRHPTRARARRGAESRLLPPRQLGRRRRGVRRAVRRDDVRRGPGPPLAVPPHEVRVREAGPRRGHRAVARLPARDRGGSQRDRRDGQGRTGPTTPSPRSRCCATPCPPGCRWSASTSATPTSCRSTTSPPRSTSSPTSRGTTARPSTSSTPSHSPSSEMLNAFCAAAGAPQFATPVDRSTAGGLLGLLPGPLRPLRIATTAWCAPDRSRCCSTRRSAASASRPRCWPTRRSGRSSTPGVPRRRWPARGSPSPTSSPTPAPCGATGRTTSTSRPGATQPPARR